jgi:hypothetical protein
MARTVDPSWPSMHVDEVVGSDERTAQARPRLQSCLVTGCFHRKMSKKVHTSDYLVLLWFSSKYREEGTPDSRFLGGFKCEKALFII